MNIDIATLLLGGTQGKPQAGRVADEGFSLAMDDKLAELIQVFPGLDPQTLAAALPVEGELQETFRQTMTDLPAVEGELLAVNPQITDVLTGAMSGNGDDNGDGESEEDPLWQLQQLVMRSVNGSEVPARPDSAKPVAAVSGDKPATQSAAAPTALAATDKTPAANSTAPFSQPIPVTNDAAAAPEFASVPNAAPLPAAVRTSVAHVPQQVVTVNHPPETPEWKQSVSQHIALFSRNGLHSAEIRLHPEELGALHISLRMQQDQAQIHIVSEHAHVRQAMEQAMPQLRAAMADSGIQLGQANVSADGQGATGEHGETAQGEHAHQREGEEEQADTEIVPTLLTTTPGNIYGINTFA
ncbi:flagellar hook-length control protein FliK [Enterobacter cancerogenus]|uniref:flagellar hook-length control protein FliK n=1 Tax=Enterobacter cancerogenus TaxID=69218 RepID=UPI00405A45C4